jgi:hypothetical protein
MGNRRDDRPDRIYTTMMDCCIIACPGMGKRYRRVSLKCNAAQRESTIAMMVAAGGFDGIDR